MAVSFILVPAVSLALVLHGILASPTGGATGLQQLESAWAVLREKDLYCHTVQLKTSVEQHLASCKDPADEAAKKKCAEEEADLLKTVETCNTEAELIDNCNNKEEKTTAVRVSTCVTLTSREVSAFESVYAPCQDILGGAENMKRFVDDCSAPSAGEESLCMDYFHVIQPILTLCWTIVNLDIPKAIGVVTPLKEAYAATMKPWAAQGYRSCLTTNQDDVEEIEKTIEDCQQPATKEDDYDCKVYFHFKEINIPQATKRVEERCKDLEQFSKDKSATPVSEVIDELKKAKKQLSTAAEACVVKIDKTVQEAKKVLLKYDSEKDEAKKNECKQDALDALWGLRTCPQRQTAATAQDMDDESDESGEALSEDDYKRELETEKPDDQQAEKDKPKEPETVKPEDQPAVKDKPKEPETVKPEYQPAEKDKPKEHELPQDHTPEETHKAEEKKV